MQEQETKKKTRKEAKKELTWTRPTGTKFDITPTPRVDDATWRLFEKLCPNGRVLLQYSTGKDSIACWLELKEKGYTVVPFFKETFKDMSFLNGPIKAHEEYFGQEILVIPNKPTFMSRIFFFNSDDDLASLGQEFKNFITLRRHSASYLKRYRNAVVDMLLAENNCDICVIGTKASDSLHRRTHFTVDGPYYVKDRLFSLLWRMEKQGPFKLAIEKKCPLPRYYLCLGRSPDFFLESEWYFIKKYYPDDYERLKIYLKNLDVYVTKYEHNPNPKHVLKPLKILKEALANGHPFV